MSELITRTARLVPYGKRPKQVPSFVTAYAYEPLADEPGVELGNLYVIIEALQPGRASEEVADLIIETVGEHYYNQRPETTDPLERFEAAVKAVNSELSEYVNRGNAAWIGKLSAILAVQAGPEFHATHTGSAEALLYRGKSSTRISTNSPTRPSTPSKTFGSIASGHLEAGDRLLIATPALIHQVPLARLQGIISQNGPNSAIAEITQLLKGAAVDRIAALVIEITTPELAALQFRSEQPSEIQLGTPDNALEAMKIAAEPIAHTTVASSKRVAGVARTGWHHAKPVARNLSLTAADAARRFLATSAGRRQALIAVFALAAVLIFAGWKHATDQQATNTFRTYQSVYSKYLHSTSRSTLQAVHDQLASLRPHERQINSKLANAALPENEPLTFAELDSRVSKSLDEADGIVKVTPTTVASFETKNAKPAHFEIIAGKAYVFDNATHKISIVNLATGSVATSQSTLTPVGDITSTTLSSTGDSVYLLTASSNIWLYRSDTDSLAEQKIAYGTWPKSSAIAAYSSNLYLLATDGTISKHVKTATGFSPEIAYSRTDAKSTSLAVDGSVYVANPTRLDLFVAGSLKRSASLPEGSGSLTNLRTTASDTQLIGTSPQDQTVTIWSISGNGPTLSKQIQLQHVTSVADAIYNAADKTFYALADDRIVRFQAQP